MMSVSINGEPIMEELEQGQCVRLPVGGTVEAHIGSDVETVVVFFEHLVGARTRPRDSK